MSLTKERIKAFITNTRLSVVDPILEKPDLESLVEIGRLALKGLASEGQVSVSCKELLHLRTMAESISAHCCTDRCDWNNEEAAQLQSAVIEILNRLLATETK